MKTPQEIGQIALGFVLLVVLVLLGWWILSGFLNYVLGLDKAVTSAIIAALVAVFSILFTFWKERTKSLQEAYRAKKIEVYSLFFDLISFVQKNSDDNETLDNWLSSKEFRDRYFDLARGVTFYGSPRVIKALSNFKTQQQYNLSKDNLSPMRSVGNVLLAMRQDLGLSNIGLDNLSIHQIYVREDLTNFSRMKADTK